jgi:two-component system chemotaxis response regulator CheB
MDVEMPRLDGLATLERLMVEHPLPVVMCSSLTRAGADATMRALELGAVDFVAKPHPGVTIEEVGAELAVKVQAAAGSRAVHRSTRTPLPAESQPIVQRPRPPRLARRVGDGRLIVIASSTGGPNALNQVMERLPGDLPAALLLVQHMPAGFTTSLANRLHSRSALEVREAVDGDEPMPGLALLAPGDVHLEIDVRGRVQLNEGPREHGVRPAADVTLRSVARVMPGRVDVVVLTGMGSDGTAGARAVKAVGGRVIAEAESTAVVWGMPRAVVEAGLADEVVPLTEIAARIVALASR